MPIEEHASLTFIVGPKHQFGYSKIAGDQWGWWCHILFADDAERAQIMSMSVADLGRRIQERYSGWAAPTGELIGRSQLWVRTPIYDVPTLPSWRRERVVLIGDAAHAMSPAGGQGASLALEDAMLLGSWWRSAPGRSSSRSRASSSCAVRAPKRWSSRATRTTSAR